MLSKTRLLKLAEKYGPFVRFTPEGTEGEEGETVLDSAIKETDKASKTPEEQTAIDEARKAEQKVEQEQGNTRRANEAARTAQAATETAQAQVEELQTKLEAAEAKAAEAGIENVELNLDDYTDTDRALVRGINALKEQMTAKDKRLDDLEKKAEGYESSRQATEAKAASNEAYNDLLSDLDTDYGADCRNTAIAEFNNLADEGKVFKGQPAKTTRVLEGCYKRAKTELAKKKKESGPDLDTGGGGGNAPNLSGVQIKEGSLAEVVAEYAALDK